MTKLTAAEDFALTPRATIEADLAQGRRDAGLPYLPALQGGIADLEHKGYATYANAKKALDKAFASIAPVDRVAMRHRFMVVAKADGRFVPVVFATRDFHVVNHLIFKPFNVVVFN